MEQEHVLPPSFFPSRMQILSGSAIKTIAVLTMLIDHIGSFLLSNVPSAMKPLFFNGPSLYRLSRDIGRIAFPIYVFLLIEGFMHTRSRIKYGRNLLIFALLSEIPWNLVHSGSLSYGRQNVYFTLLFGYLAICLAEKFHDHPWPQVASLLLFFFLSEYFRADYGWKGYIFILLMYLLRYEKMTQAVAGSCWLYYEWKACFAFLPINMYNGKRGYIKGNLKYAFYLFYPVHLFLLYLLKYYVF